MKYLLTRNDNTVRYIPESAISRMEHNNDDGTWEIILLDGFRCVVNKSPELFNPFGDE